jgi:hypothetical protein
MSYDVEGLNTLLVKHKWFEKHKIENLEMYINHVPDYPEYFEFMIFVKNINPS